MRMSDLEPNSVLSSICQTQRAHTVCAPAGGVRKQNHPVCSARASSRVGTGYSRDKAGQSAPLVELVLDGRVRGEDR